MTREPAVKYCPRCGHENPSAAILCLNRRCRWLLSNPHVPEKHRIAQGASGGPTTQMSPQDISSSTDLKRAGNASSRQGSGSAVDRQIPGRGKKRWIKWGIFSAVVMALPAAFLAGYLQSFGQVRSALIHQNHPHRIRVGGGISGPSPKNPTRPIYPSWDQPSISTTSTASSSAASTVRSYTLHGTIVNGQLVTTVWAAAHAQGPYYPVRLMVDTGAMTTMIGGNFWTAMGDPPLPGQTSIISGIGGNETVDYWAHVWVLPQDGPGHPLLADTIEPGGLNRSMLRADGIMVLMGQNVLSRGTLVQKGTTWTFTYSY